MLLLPRKSISDTTVLRTYSTALLPQLCAGFSRKHLEYVSEQMKNNLDRRVDKASLYCVDIEYYSAFKKEGHSAICTT